MIQKCIDSGTFRLLVTEKVVQSEIQKEYKVQNVGVTNVFFLWVCRSSKENCTIRQVRLLNIIWFILVARVLIFDMVGVRRESRFITAAFSYVEIYIRFSEANCPVVQVFSLNLIWFILWNIWRCHHCTRVIAFG